MRQAVGNGGLELSPMSYHVHVHARGTEIQYREVGPSIFEHPERLTPLTPAGRATLEEELRLRGFAKRSESDGAVHFEQPEWKCEAMLTETGLYLSASGESAIFEILMFGSEVANDDFAKYDPQLGTWE